jgi:Zn-dependent peptidase ImmA (M78 family)
MVETFIILLHGDRDFNGKQRNLIEDVIDEWYRFTKGKLLFHIEFDLHKNDVDAPMRDDLIFKVNSKFCLVRRWDEQNNITGLGYCYNKRKRGSLYMVSDRLTDDNAFKTTLMHELGHYIGLDHTPKGSIMTAFSGEEKGFTEIDAIEFCSKYGGTLDDLHYSVR